MKMRTSPVLLALAVLLGIVLIGGGWYAWDRANQDASEPETVSLWVRLQRPLSDQFASANDGDYCSFETEPWNQLVVYEAEPPLNQRGTILGVYRPVDGTVEKTSQPGTRHCEVVVQFSVPADGAYLISPNGGEDLLVLSEDLAPLAIPVIWEDRSAPASPVSVASPVASPQPVSFTRGDHA